jgi:hypothetical protein
MSGCRQEQFEMEFDPTGETRLPGQLKRVPFMQ